MVRYINAFIAGMIFVLALHWVSGAEFQRSPTMAITVLLGVMVGFISVGVVCWMKDFED